MQEVLQEVFCKITESFHQHLFFFKFEASLSLVIFCRKFQPGFFFKLAGSFQPDFAIMQEVVIWNFQEVFTIKFFQPYFSYRLIISSLNLKSQTACTLSRRDLPSPWSVLYIMVYWYMSHGLVYIPWGISVTPTISRIPIKVLKLKITKCRNVVSCIDIIIAFLSNFV